VNLHARTPTSERPGGSNGPPRQVTETPHRVLLIANETVAAPSVRARIADLVGGRQAEVFVVAPALTGSRFKHFAGEVDEAIEAARARLDACVQALRAIGIEASGDVGDSDPNLALEDALRRFAADEVVISTHPPERSKWLEQDVVEQARRAVRQSVTHVVVDDASGEGTVADVERIKEAGTPAVVQEDEDMTAYGLPRMSASEVAAIVVGIVGTIVLAILAGICVGDVSNESMSAGCAIRIGLAAASFIVTLFHVAALLFFSSVRYHGRWASFAATTLLLGIPPAIVLSLIVG
jgi:hypothetical protein